jgi:hypothetical protein
MVGKDHKKMNKYILPNRVNPLAHISAASETASPYESDMSEIKSGKQRIRSE